MPSHQKVEWLPRQVPDDWNKPFGFAHIIGAVLLSLCGHYEYAGIILLVWHIFWLLFLLTLHLATWIAPLREEITPSRLELRRQREQEEEEPFVSPVVVLSIQGSTDNNQAAFDRYVDSIGIPRFLAEVQAVVTTCLSLCKVFPEFDPGLVTGRGAAADRNIMRIVIPVLPALIAICCGLEILKEAIQERRKYQRGLGFDDIGQKHPSMMQHRRSLSERRSKRRQRRRTNRYAQFLEDYDH